MRIGAIEFYLNEDADLDSIGFKAWKHETGAQ